jgi:hypothetical protein
MAYFEQQVGQTNLPMAYEKVSENITTSEKGEKL